MKKKIVSGIMLTLLLLSMSTLVFNIQLVKASGTIYIRADGSVDPDTAPIQRDGNVYTLTGNIYDEIVIERDNIVVDGAGYTVQGTGGGYGIYLSYRNNVTVKDVEVTNFYYGIYLYRSSGNTIIDSTASYNWRAIYLVYSGSNVLSANTATNNSYGIYLYYSGSNVLSGNTASGNSNNFGVRGRYFSEFNNYVDTSNKVDGKPIYYLIGVADTVYDAKTNAGTIYLINCNNVTVRDLTLTNNEYGVLFWKTANSKIENVTASNVGYGIELLYYSSGNVLAGNNVSNNFRGIVLYIGCHRNVLSGNTASHNSYGIYLDSSSRNVLSGNTASHNSYYGIHLRDSSNINTLTGNNVSNNYDIGILLYSLSNENTITGNNASNNHNGIWLDFSNDNILSGNTASNNYGRGIYLESSRNNILSGNIASHNGVGIRLYYGCKNNVLSRNNASNNGVGIRLYRYCSNNVLSGNTASNNRYYGIVLYVDNTNNILFGNTISNNHLYGIYLYRSSNNVLFYNNLINNTVQARVTAGSVNNVWDDGYPSGGNYWSDHVTVDDYSGIYQNEPGSDGIVDDPYIIDDYNQDNYPLVKPWSMETVYIKADGSVYPSTAPISTVDNITYTLTDNIVVSLYIPEDWCAIVVERDNIVVDGAGYTVQGVGERYGIGIYLSYRNNVTVKDVEVTNLEYGILLDYSSNNTLIGNNASNNVYGIYLDYSSNNTLIGNTASHNFDLTPFYERGEGIWLHYSSNNTLIGNNARSNCWSGILLDHSNDNVLSGNTASNNWWDGIRLYVSRNNALSGNTASSNTIGIWLTSSSNNSISGNNITNSDYEGIRVWMGYDNIIYHNNFIDNTVQAVDNGINNVWDDGYPSGGNFWSDYGGADLYIGPYQNETGSDGIGDTPYVIDVNIQDNYPFVNPWFLDTTPPAVNAGLDQTVDEDTSVTFDGSGSSDNVGITSYTWTFVDVTPQTLSGVNPTYIFQTPGVYAVTLNVSDAADNWATDEVIITVLDVTTPVADAGLDQTVDENTSVTFDGSGSSDNVGITSYTWTFVDVTPQTLSGVNPTYTFQTPGIYTVTLNVSDAADNWATDEVIITALDVTTPVADAGLDQTVDEDTQVTFDGSASFDNVGIVSYVWTFTDMTPQTLTGVTPTYTFTDPGVYLVTLNVSDSAGNYATDTVTITVHQDPEALTQRLASTIENWNLSTGTENSLTSKLEETILLLNKGNENGAIHKLMDFMNQVEALRDKGKLENWQADYLISEAQTIIDLVKG